MNIRQRIIDLKQAKAEQARKMAAMIEAADFDAAGEAYTGEVKALEKLDADLKAAEALFAQLGAMELPEDKPGQKGFAGGENGYEKAVKEMASAARKGFRTEKAMSAGSDEDGGYTVPHEVVTQIYHLMEQEDSLMDLIQIVAAPAPSGEYTQSKRGSCARFATVAEWESAEIMPTPEFDRVSYECSDKYGIFPVTQKLLRTSDANIVSELNAWIAKGSAATWDHYILQRIKSKTAVNLINLDGIRKAYLLDLNAAFRANAYLLTNEFGEFWLSTLKDENGRDLLTPDPSTPGKTCIVVGAHKIPIRVKSSKVLPNDGENVPMVIGYLNEGIRGFRQDGFSVTDSDVAVVGTQNAFTQSLRFYKAHQSDDTIVWDSEAWINGYINAADIVDDPRLSTLSIGSVTLSPAFDPDVTEYTAETSNATNTITATAADTSTDTTVSIKNGATAVTSGSAATWASGLNTVTIEVTAGSKSKTYTVKVTKS